MGKKEKKAALKSLRKDETKLNESAEKFSQAWRNDQMQEILPDDKVQRLKYIQRMSAADYEEKLKGIQSGETPAPVSYEDSDQSPLSGEEAQFLRNQWGKGMDYQPHIPLPHLSYWLLCCFMGDFEAFLNCLEGKSSEEVRKLIKKRETMMNVGALTHVIHGARVLLGDKPKFQEIRSTLNSPGDHIKIFDKLLSLGADVNVRDVAGYTLLHNCVTFGNDITKEMATKLINNGADVNAKSRFGETPLQICTAGNRIEFIEFLLDHGADSFIEDNEKSSPQSLAQAMRNVRVLKMFGAASAKSAKVAREEVHGQYAGGNFKQCQKCESYDRDTKRCTGCYLVWYCSSDCQKSDWENHKEQCRKTRKDFIPVAVKKEHILGFDLLTGKNETNIEKAKKPSRGHFIVKIQVNLDNTHGPLMIYKKDKTLYGKIQETGNEVAFATISKQVRKNGNSNGTKGYFYAIHKNEEGDNVKVEMRDRREIVIEINPTEILPIENW